MDTVLLDLTAMLRWLEQMPIGDSVRMVPYLYPVLMAAHVLGIALLVGPALAVDLRLLGMGRGAIRVSTAAKLLLPLSHIGFGIVVLTGLLMFTGIAMVVGTSSAAVWKFGLIGLAALNIVVFHKGIYRSVAEWDLNELPPFPARAAAVVSAISWIGAIFGGRFLAY